MFAGRALSRDTRSGLQGRESRTVVVPIRGRVVGRVRLEGVLSKGETMVFKHAGWRWKLENSRASTTSREGAEQPITASLRT